MGGGEGIYTYPEGMNPKMNAIFRLEFELAYFEAVA